MHIATLTFTADVYQLAIQMLLCYGAGVRKLCLQANVAPYLDIAAGLCQWPSAEGHVAK